MAEKQYEHILRSITLIRKHNPFVFNFLVFLSVISGFVPLVTVWLIKLLIDYLLKAIETQHGFDTTFYFLIAATTLTVLLSLLLHSLLLWISELHSSKLTGKLFDELHRKSTGLGYPVFENPGEQDVAFRARNELAYRPHRLTGQIMNFIQGLTAFLTSVWLVAYLNPWMAVVFFALMIPAIWVRLNYANHEWEWKRKKTRLERKNMYFGRILTDAVFAKEIRLFGLSDYFTHEFGRSYNTLLKEKNQFLRLKNLTELKGYLFISLVFMVALFYVAHKAIHKSITPGDAVMYMLVFQRTLTFIRTIMTSITGIYEDTLGMKNLFEFLSRPEPEKTPVNETNQPQLHHNIIIQNVSFTYTSQKQTVFKNLNLEIPAGKTTILVGENGSGKTTLVKLLARLYHPDSGTIYFDNTDIRSFPEKQYREFVSVLFQDFVLYHLSARENIAFGKISELNNDDRLKQAAKKAGISDAIESMPSSYETTLGFLDENSVELSMGQWQRLAMARSFFKDSEIILLDEPTSAMDAFHEAMLFQTLKELVRNKTAIIVSHRLSLARNADHIILLTCQGDTETGTHSQLMQKNGTYARMFLLQSQLYI